LAAGVAAIEEYKRLGLIERSQRVGEELGQQLKGLQRKHPSLGDVRGLGLFWGLELVRDRKTKEGFNTREDKLQGKPLIVDRVAGECMKNGVFINTWINYLTVAPPLIIEKNELNQGVAALDKALDLADKEVTS
jgi:taurine--2-oxoglutarate transaminase